MIQGVSRLAQRAGASLLLAACTYTGDGENPTATAAEDTQGSDTYAGSSSGSTSTTGDPLPQLTSTGSTDPSTSSDASTSGDTGSTGGTSGGATTGEAKSCKKIDLLFMIENHGEMVPAYAAIDEMLDHLVKRVEEEMSDWDYHMMVVKGDANWGLDACEERCELSGSCAPLLPEYPCEYTPSACDMTLGAGSTFPVGAWTSNVECPIAGDQRYIVSGQPDLGGTLDCLRTVGFSGDPKRMPVGSVLSAISPDLNAAGGCNEGFIRDDAYLVVMVISSSGDVTTLGTTEEWKQALLATHGGKFDKVFLLGLFNDGYSLGICGDSQAPTSIKNLIDWVDSIYHSKWGSVCEDDFRPYLDEALDYVQGDCQE